MTVAFRDSAQIDPDPYAVAAIWISGATFLLQFIQVAREIGKDIAAIRTSSASKTRLSRLEQAVEELQLQLDQLNRTIDRGSSDPERQFYDAPVRVGRTALLLDRHSFDELGTGLSHAHVKTGALALWANGLIMQSPADAAAIGAALPPETAERLNTIIAEGRPIREAIAESRTTLDAARVALRQMLTRTDND